MNVFNTFTANDKYSSNIKENFPQPIQRQLYKKQRSLCPIFIAFLNLT